MSRDGPLVATRVALLFLAGAAILALAGCGRLDKDGVSAELKTIQSSSAEGMLVAGQAARSRAPNSFIEIRTAELLKQSRNAADELAATPTEPGLQQAAKRGSELGSSAARLLGSLHSDPGNGSLAASVEARLRSLSDEAGNVESSL
jgi:hypothetical protein